MLAARVLLCSRPGWVLCAWQCISYSPSAIAHNVVLTLGRLLVCYVSCMHAGTSSLSAAVRSPTSMNASHMVVLALQLCTWFCYSCSPQVCGADELTVRASTASECVLYLVSVQVAAA
jgi:hypothetical protein